MYCGVEHFPAQLEPQLGTHSVRSTLHEIICGHGRHPPGTLEKLWGKLLDRSLRLPCCVSLTSLKLLTKFLVEYLCYPDHFAVLSHG